MIVVYIFILGCFVTGIAAVGLVFAFAAVGFEPEQEMVSSEPEISAESPTTPSRENFTL